MPKNPNSARQVIRGVGWKKQSTIDADKYKQVSRAILSVLTTEPITFTELTRRATEKLPGFDGSVGWYTITVARELEVQGKVVRTTKPTRYAKPGPKAGATRSKRVASKPRATRQPNKKLSKPAETAVEPRLVTRVREMLSGVKKVEEKRMFGSKAFMVRGKMCITARNEYVMCRLDPDEHDTLVKREGCEEVRMGGRLYRGYIRVNADAVKTRRALQGWVDKALVFNRSLNK